MRCIAILLVLLVTGCSEADDPPTPFSRSTLVMGTTLDITVYRPKSDSDIAAADLSVAVEIISGIDQRMSLYKSDSELSALNARMGSAPVPVSAPLFDLLTASDFYATLSDGAFDATIQPLVALWGFYDVRQASVPAQNEIDATLRVVGPTRMQLNESDNTVSLSDSSAIDLGGIAKGYAIDIAITALEDRGARAALINLGGAVGVLGTPPGERPWVIGIKHPRGDRLIGQLSFKAGAVSTSGDYDRYFESDGQRYSHLLDPRTGWPVDGLYALAVHAPTATAADALSTAAFVLGSEDGMALLSRCKDVSGLVVVPVDDETIDVTVASQESGPKFVVDSTEEVVVNVRERDGPEVNCAYPRNET